MHETKVFTMRLDPELIERIDKLNDRRFSLAGGKGKPPAISRAETIRWLLAVGIEEVSKDLDDREAKLKASEEPVRRFNLGNKKKGGEK